MSQPLLSINAVYKEYGSTKTRVQALKGVSLSIMPGEIVGLLGVNGAGKTTLSSLIATLHPPTQGSITWQGKSIHDNITQYRSIVGYCPQKPNLSNALTVEQNLRLAGKYQGLSAAQVEEQLQHVVQQYELQEMLSRMPNTLSGGYRQRVMIARALMHKPKLVILDEPTVGLDPHIRRQLWQSIQQLKNEGVTVILTTHYLDEAEYLSDRICILDHGKILLVDTPHNLKNAHNKHNLEEVFLALMQQSENV